MPPSRRPPDRDSRVGTADVNAAGIIPLAKASGFRSTANGVHHKNLTPQLRESPLAKLTFSKPSSARVSQRLLLDGPSRKHPENLDSMDKIAELWGNIPPQAQWALAGVGALVVAEKLVSVLQLVLNVFLLSGINVS